ncbi:MAG TPA: hypothetical protein VMS56_14230 [Thermoanaerobaculia bacterium]|nr:hypothetical protein [Thermoanaerobaculia bacterium]
MKRLAALVTLLLLASCATARRPVDTLGAASPAEAWRALLGIREEFRGARSFLTIRPEGSRRFDAILEVDPRGRVALSGLSPVGTTLFRLFGNRDRVLFLDERRNTYWVGTFAEFADRTGLFRGIPFESAAELAMLLLGLPAGTAEGVGEWMVAPDGLRYRVAKGGLAEVVGADGAARIVYDPPVWPPSRVRVETAAAAIGIDHREIVVGDTEVVIPAPEESWKCCFLPRVVGEE